MKNTALLLSLAVLALITLAGLAAIGWQVREGLGVTAMREPVAWGLYVVGFAYFFGMGAGALTFAAAAVASRRDDLRPPARIAAPVALVALALSGAMINLDLGRPERAWMLALKAQPQSPLVIDFIVLNALLGVALILTYFTVRGTVAANSANLPLPLTLPFTLGRGSALERHGRRLVELVAAVTAIAAPVLYLLTVRVFSSVQARPAWHSTLLAPSFLVSALLAGAAAVGLAMLLADAEFAKRPATVVWQRVVLALAGIGLILQASPLLTMRQFTSPPTLAHIEAPGAAMALELSLGLVVPLLLLCAGRPGRFRAGLACLLLLAGVFVKRWHVITTGMTTRALPLEEGGYLPNLVEITAAAGITAGAVFVLVVLLAAYAALDKRGGEKTHAPA